MESQNTASVEKTSPPVVNPAASSCRKKKTEGASFIADVREHIDEFIHASMDEHKTCFKKTIQKMFGMSKVVAERSAETAETAEKKSKSLCPCRQVFLSRH
ncbi:uncharacterized protein LOC120266477 isoform X2 [Dioscorea cayenensis subsp. rotundata]|nr:uncharacterized protein LOC120266477 isoform X2 [Dioscorea cayenensis subsp. rotundata]XP_039130046.1 uncharacterized protein LOC120266477 isoform X2 [Dioscorea cayenensis subsp. rotundata]